MHGCARRSGHGEHSALRDCRCLRACAAAEALLQPRSFASRHEGARSRRDRGHRSVERVLPHSVQRHRAQVGRAAAYAVILLRHMPDHPVLILADYYLATFLKQPTWVEDLRPFRAVMMPLVLPAQRSDIDRFIPQDGAEASWIAYARAAYAFDMASAVRRALKDLRLEHGRVAFDDMGFGFRLEVEGLEVAD